MSVSQVGSGELGVRSPTCMARVGFRCGMVGATKALSSAQRVGVLYRLHGTAILARCRRLLRDQHWAEDATQETFIRVARHADSIPAGDEALRWIYRIATNYCLNQLRDQKGSLPLSDALLTEERLGTSFWEQAFVDRDLVRRILAAMPEKIGVVVILRHVDGLQDAEVAHRLGVSRRTVAYRLTEFRRRMRNLDDGDFGHLALTDSAVPSVGIDSRSDCPEAC